MNRHPARSPQSDDQPAQAVRQLQWDFSARGHQLRMLAHAVFARSYPAPGGKNVSGAAVRAVLRMIDVHAGSKSTCFASIPTIAKETGHSKSVVKRAIAVLRDDLAIVIEEEERDSAGHRRSMHRTICWANLASLAEPQTAGEKFNPARIRRSLDAAWLPPRDHEGQAQGPRGASPGTTAANLTTYGTEKEPPPPITTNVLDKAAAELVSLGVEWPGAALEAARLFISDEQILALIAFYREQGPMNGWGPGALVRRLKNSRHHNAIDRGWPAASTKAVQSQRQADDSRKRRAAEEEAERKAKEDKAAAERRERELGPYLDRMPSLDQDELARRVLTVEQLKLCRHHRHTKTVRRWLLQALEKELGPKP